MFFATEVLDKVKSNFFLFSGQIIFPLQNCKEKLGGDSSSNFRRLKATSIQEE